MVYFWRTTYCGLTKKGKLIFCEHMYQTPEQAFLTLDLTSPTTRINGKLTVLAAEIESGGEKILIKFPSTDDLSSWLRALSDFGIGAARQIVSNKVVAKKRAPEKVTTQAVTPTTETVNKDDELSAMYGM